MKTRLTKLLLLLLIAVATSTSAFAQQQGICQDMNLLKSRMYELGQVYMFIPEDTNDFGKYSISCLKKYFEDLGLYVIGVQGATYEVSEKKITPTAREAKQMIDLKSLPKIPELGDNTNYISICVDLSTSFEDYAGYQCGMYITIIDNRNFNIWYKQIYPMPTKYKKVKAKLQKLFFKSLK